jgi:protein NRD1
VASPAPPAPPAGLNPDLQRQIMIIKTLSEAGVPQDQWGPIIAALSTAQNGSLPPGNSATPPVAPPPVTQYPGPGAPPSNGWSNSSSRDQFRHDDDNLRSPQGRYRRRSRSPSPGRGWNTRDSPTARRHDGHDDRGRNGNGDNYDRYRQRSPQRRGSPAPHSNYYDGRSGGAKWIDHDPHLPKGSIKVLSRTLFVGGVT